MKVTQSFVGDLICRPQSGSGNIHHDSPRNNFLNNDLSTGRPLLMKAECCPAGTIRDEHRGPEYLVPNGANPSEIWYEQRFMYKYFKRRSYYEDNL